MRKKSASSNQGNSGRRLDGRDMCGWPPARKDFFTCLHRRPIAVMCTAWRRGARPQALMGSVDRGLIKPAGSRCPMSRHRYTSIRRLTDDAITLVHPRKVLCSVSVAAVAAVGRSSVAPRGRDRQSLAASRPASILRDWGEVVEPGAVFILQIGERRYRCRPPAGPRRDARGWRCRG